MKGCVKHIHNFWPEMASWPGMALWTEMYFWLEIAFQTEMAFRPEMAFWLCQILSKENCITIIILSNKSALLLKVLKGLARL